MPKRNAEARIEYHRNKIRRIEEKSRPRRRRIILSSSDSSDNEDRYDTDVITSLPTENVALQAETNVEPLLEINPSNSEVPPGDILATQEPIIELDPEILSALGTKIGDEPQYGEKIHDSLAQLWLPLLKKGIPKEDKEKILKGYLIPQNCTLLQAPALNPEISAAITESTRIRDKKMISGQQQLGAGITAVNRAMDILVGPSGDKLTTIKYLSDACRILSDLHHVQTQARVKLITPSLDKSFLQVIQDTCRDETLFGNNLSEKIKASKAIEKQGLQIKKFVSNPTPSTSTARPFQQRGNWTGPPRYSSSKAARGGMKRTPTYRKSNSTPAAQSKPPNRPQTRAQTQQQ